jgi:U4/U6.U5 tri-snRNP-associated protein 1
VFVWLGCADVVIDDLSGIKVAHGEDAFEEGEEVILTLKDNRILDGDAEDELQNVNLADAEAERRAKERKKKAKAQYTGYDDEEFEEGEAGIGKKRGVLGKYDDDDFTMQSAGGEGFRLGGRGERKRARVDKMEEGDETINLGVNKQLMTMDYTSECVDVGCRVLLTPWQKTLMFRITQPRTRRSRKRWVSSRLGNLC